MNKWFWKSKYCQVVSWGQTIFLRTLSRRKDKTFSTSQEREVEKLLKEYSLLRSAIKLGSGWKGSLRNPQTFPSAQASLLWSFCRVPFYLRQATAEAHAPAVTSSVQPTPVTSLMNWFTPRSTWPTQLNLDSHQDSLLFNKRPRNEPSMLSCLRYFHGRRNLLVPAPAVALCSTGRPVVTPHWALPTPRAIDGLSSFHWFPNDIPHP